MQLPSNRRHRWIRMGLLATVLAAAPFASVATSAASGEGNILRANGPRAIAGSYIVVLNDSAVSPQAVPSKASALAARHGGTVMRTYQHALRGFEARISESAARRLAADPSVLYVEQNQTVSLTETQSPTPSWGLDRVDQRNLPLDDSYTYPTLASNVRAYVIDTGIRFTHQDFGGRAVSGRDTIDDDNDATDCHGHGTHVSGTVGGTSFGIAKGVTLVGVRVLNCSGSGSTSGVIEGIDWVTGDHDPSELAVANMSLGGSFSQSLNDAVAASIADGVSYAVAAGNDSSDSCDDSPGSTPEAITVGSTQSDDRRSSFSNYGTCNDIFAPGSSITSAWIDSDTDTDTISGTSMASPHVAGVAALILSQNPSFTPQQIRDRMVEDATPDVISNPGTGSPNRLLYVNNAGTPTDDFSVTMSPTSGSAEPGGSVTATVSTAVTNGKPQQVTFSATGLPSGATATFNPNTVTAGESSTMTIATSATTPAGTYTVRVTGTGTAATRTANYALTITGAPGCVQTNGNDVAIPDNTTVESTVTISGCPGNASAASTAEVHIVHTYQGDLVVRLIAPDSTAYTLHNRSGGGTNDIHRTYTVNLSSETANGTWKLQVQDMASNDIGRIDTWTLTLDATGTPGTCTGYDNTRQGTLSSGSSEYQPDGRYVYVGTSGTHEACLDGPDGTDFDLYLQKWNGYGWNTVASGTTSGPDETLTYNGTSGYYRYRVHAYSGSGSYTLGYNTP